MLKVWIGVLTPFFKKRPLHLQCLKHLPQFIIFDVFHSHTEETLRMMNAAMAGYEYLLKNFVQSRDSGNFDRIPKLHMMGHYAESIGDFRSYDNPDTERSEAAHSLMIKEAYRSTNQVKPIL
jgi:hypothetical protein